MGVVYVDGVSRTDSRLGLRLMGLAGAIGLAAWRGDGGLPRWLAYFSAVFVLEQAVETITIFGKSGFIAPGGDMNFQLGAGLLFVWLIALGVATSKGRADTPAVATAR